MQGTASPNPKQQPLHVSIFINDLTGGGAERQTLTLARELRTRRVAVELIVHQLRGELVNQIPIGVDVVDLDRRRTRHDIAPLARHLRQRRPDILLANIDHKNIAAILARVLSAVRTKVVITQHNPLAGELSQDGRRYRIIIPAYRILRPFIDAAVAVSDGIARELVELAGFPEKKVVRIYNAAIGTGFEARANMPVEHPWFNEDDPAPVFVSAARLVPQKDHETLLRAMALYRRTCAGRLLILGAGPLREHLGKFARELQIADAVDFVGFQENPLPWFRCADVFVLPSRSEGFGIALAEAMGCGTPIISTDGYGPSEIVDRGRHGVLVPPEDPNALAAALTAVGEMRRRFPSESLKARAAEFSDAACASGYLSLFHRLTIGGRDVGGALPQGQEANS